MGVADLDECDDSIARRDHATTVSNSNTIDNTSNSFSLLDHLDSSSITHSSAGVNTATLEVHVVQKEVLLMYADDNVVVVEQNANLVEAYKNIGEEGKH